MSVVIVSHLINRQIEEATASNTRLVSYFNKLLNIAL